MAYYCITDHLNLFLFCFVFEEIAPHLGRDLLITCRHAQPTRGRLNRRAGLPPSACQRAYWESGSQASPWVVVPLKEAFELEASQGMALRYIYSLGSDQMGSFRVNEKEQKAACEEGNESLAELRASYAYRKNKKKTKQKTTFAFAAFHRLAERNAFVVRRWRTS